MMGQLICAWCKKKMGKCDIDGSHGICEECMEKWLEELNNERRK